MTVQLPDQDLLVHAGEAITFDVLLTTIDDAVPDLSQCTARYVATRLRTGTTHIRKDMPDGLSWVAPDRLRVTLTPGDTEHLGGLNLLHEVRIWDAAGNPSHAMSGALIVRPSFA